MDYLKLTDIVIDQDRLRKDLGDVQDLAQSILDNSTSLIGTKGLMHPIVVNSENVLIAGGRRYAAFTLLASNKVKNDMPDHFATIPFTRVEQLSPARRRMLEIEENRRRKSMTWQEDLMGVYDYHKLARREALADGDKWTQQMTADMFNVSQASISIMLDLAKVMQREPESNIAKADTITAALQLLAQRELDTAAKEQLRRIELRRADAAKNIVLAGAQVSTTTIEAGQQKIFSGEAGFYEQAAQAAGRVGTSGSLKPVLTAEQIASFYYQGSCLDLLPELKKRGPINHIICDPPFGIDMANIDTGATGKIDRVSAEHEVEANVSLLKRFLQVAFECISEDGFLCMWYDLDHHEKLQAWANEAGWTVCRWPFIWCKSSNCVNNAAQYNITKATEACMILRRSPKAIIKVKQDKNWIVCDAVRDPTHPFVKPPQVWDYLIDTVSVEGDTIVDPFAGQGSSLVQFFKKNRVPMGIELKEEHIANGIGYIQKRLGKMDVDLNSLLSESPL
jgi:ParB-like chromosome segregation protein Spo0J/DNA modification methylase